MKEWKIRQEIYRRLNTNLRDDLTDVDIEWRPDDIVQDAIRHFNERVDEWIYPAKSYFVAICYAKWISEDFEEEFYDVLDDPDLLPGDPHFVPYSEAIQEYDEILMNCHWDEDDQGMVPDVREYYEEEIQL